MRHLTQYDICAAALLAIAGCNQDTSTPKTPLKKAEKLQAASEIIRTPTKNAYFGDLHVHTKNSFDAFIVGTRTTADDAYRFAKGETIDNGAGTRISLDGRPLDFYGVTDHGEYMGVIAAMRDQDNPISKTKTAKSIFGAFAGDRQSRRNAFLQVGLTIVTGDEINDIYDRDFIDSAWAENVAAAEKHNNPGTFTTFLGYEFTAMQVVGTLADNAGALNLHRNVIFKDQAPDRIFSTLDSTNPEDLWDWMNMQRSQGYDVLSIPHNSNASNGTMFASAMTDGSEFTADYSQNRMKNEPIIEITQVKGTSETHPMLSPNDEFAGHELYEILVGTPNKSKVMPGSYARTALGRGLGVENALGVNPYEFGFIGSTDTHISGSSLSEETFFGKFASDADMAIRGTIPPGGAKTWPEGGEAELDFIAAPLYGASGLAGVWAEANTREDLFDGMRRKETFATSGPRIRVRFFAGSDYDAALNAPDMITQAYARGVSMGGKVEASESSPDFLIWAMRDAESAPLQRAQIIKVTDGAETVYDVACADGNAPDPTTRRCEDSGASVDLANCGLIGSGASELKTVWQDPDWQAGQKAAYYVRVVENPKCRWSTWDAVRNGTPPNPAMEATVQDRAWSSPIWTE